MCCSVRNDESAETVLWNVVLKGEKTNKVQARQQKVIVEKRVRLVKKRDALKDRCSLRIK